MDRWNSITEDPNSSEAHALRDAALRRARAEPIEDRIEYLKSLAKGRRVLDVGVVDHMVESQQKPNWLHREIAGVCEYCLGIDVLQDAIGKMRESGFNVRCCDITRETPAGEGPFDLMICGELIEHLGNPAELFAAAKRVLAPGGRLIITTPNPYYIARIRNNIAGRSTDSVDHVTLLFPSGIAELAEREGLFLERYRGVKLHAARTMAGRLFLRLNHLMVGRSMTAEAACETIIYEVARPQEHS